MSQRSLFDDLEEEFKPTDQIKALSLWQPWATAIALELKKIETRAWSTDYRGPLLIHAAKKWTKDVRDTHQDLRRRFSDLPEKPPLGQAICIVDLVDCRAMSLDWMKSISETEYRWGNWAEGRYGWVLENVRLFRNDVELKMRGYQALWSVSADDWLSKLAS